MLASSSPRRRRLLEEAGLEFEVRASEADELHDASLPLGELCERNAERKARAAAERGALVIGADTLVGIDDEPLGKPADSSEARAMLRRLSGRGHLVCTGVCLIGPHDRVERFHERTRVWFRELGDETIDEYFRQVNPLDKAGGYGIQQHGELLVERIEGDYDNVVGLPVAALLDRLRACGAAGGGV